MHPVVTDTISSFVNREYLLNFGFKYNFLNAYYISDIFVLALKLSNNETNKVHIITSFHRWGNCYLGCLNGMQKDRKVKVCLVVTPKLLSFLNILSFRHLCHIICDLMLGHGSLDMRFAFLVEEIKQYINLSGDKMKEVNLPSCCCGLIAWKWLPHCHR